MNNESKRIVNISVTCGGPVLGSLGLLVYVTWCTSWIDCCSVGLILNIIGTLILVFFGFPQPDYSGGGFFAEEDGDIDEITGKTRGVLRREAECLAKWHKRCSIVGIGYLLVGFICQLVHQLTSG